VSEAREAVAQKPRVRYIDGLRAVAVLAVVLFHATKYVPNLTGDADSAPLRALTHVLQLGYHGVDLFFVLSGYCLAYPTIARFRHGGEIKFNLPHYFARRFVRILPPYEIALALFVAVLGVCALLGRPAPPDMLPHLNVNSVLHDAFLLDRNTVHVNQSFWTLALEFRWYFIFPFALALWLRSPRAFLFAIGACVFADLTTYAASDDLAYLPAFLLGIVAVDLELRQPAWVRYAPAVFVAALIAASVVPVPAGITVSFFWQLALFAFVVSAGRIGWLRAALSFPALFEIGVASYSIYLIHQPLVAVVAGPIAGVFTNPWVAVLATSAVGVFGGWLFWLIVERALTAPVMKARLEGALAPHLYRLFNALRIPHQMVFGRPAYAAQDARVEAPAPEPVLVGAQPGRADF
jgi:peptidoglycan/LPS O-acetylase OafA/YrhL